MSRVVPNTHSRPEPPQRADLRVPSAPQHVRPTTATLPHPFLRLFPVLPAYALSVSDAGSSVFIVRIV